MSATASTASAPIGFLSVIISILPILLILAIIALIIVCFLVFRKKNTSPAFEPTAEFPHKTVVYIDGMSCEHCSSRVQAAFSEKGYKIKVNLEQKNAEVLSKEPLNQAEASTTVQDLGFTPVQISVIQ